MKTINKSYNYAYNESKEFEKYEVIHSVDSSDKAVIVRLDGHSITKTFKSNEDCFDLSLYRTMYKISANIIQYFPYIIRSYSFKDEISILVDYKNFLKDEYYKNRQEKLISILAGYVSSMFNLYLKNDSNGLFSFDARILYMPNELVKRYFRNRMNFSTYGYFERISNFYNLHENGKICFDIEKLINDKNIKKCDLKEYICWGISGRFKGNTWVVTPDQNKKIRPQNKKRKNHKEVCNAK